MSRGYSYTLNIGDHLMNLKVPKVMGILNVTPDSFYSESRTIREDDIRNRIREMISEGADIIDIGGFSTRPGFRKVTEEEEMERVNLGCRILRDIAPDFPLSIDTFRSSVAKRSISKWNAGIINDISGGEDINMFNVVAQNRVAYVLTHNSKQHPQYNDITADVITDLSKKVNELHRLGVTDVIIDPGFGFAKTIDENYSLLNELEEVAKMGLPLLVGISRKSMIYKTLECSPEESLVGTVALNTISLDKGANILRVHDVKPAVETIKLFKKLKENAR